jgi:hypothetical protein
MAARRKNSAGAVLAFALAGCGGDALAPPPPPPSVSGDWTYAASGLVGTIFDEEITCTYDLAMQLTGDAMFSGTYRDSRLVCTLFGTPQIVALGGGTIVDGAIEGSSVRFDMDAASIHNTGVLSGDAMSGDVEITLVVQHYADIDTTLVTGRWAASR